MVPPRARIGTITPEERATVRSRSPVGGKYDTPLNRESAHEKLAQRAEQEVPATKDDARAPTSDTPAPTARDAEGGGFGQTIKDWLFGTKRRQGAVEAMAKSTARTVGNKIGREILRGVLGGASRRR
jgi:hypothetical protein